MNELDTNSVEKMNYVTSQTQFIDGTETVLGDQFLIPFKVSEMQRAKDSLTVKNVIPPHSFQVKTTHLYVKFTPNTYDELDILYHDSTLDISSVPKDYIIDVQGSWYRDPNISDSVPNPQYASVRLEYNFPIGVNYEVLDSLYVPDEDIQLMTTNPGKPESYYADLLMSEAFRINPFPDPQFAEFMPHPGPYAEYDWGIVSTPVIHGVIHVWDNRLNASVPLQGVKVESRRHGYSTAYRSGYTNAAGEYSLSGSQAAGTSNYKIIFSRHGFQINNNVINRYEITAHDRSRHSFSLDITGDTYAQFCATMFRAAYRYYYGNVDGLLRPFRTGPVAPDQRIIAKNSYDDDHAGINYVVLPNLHVHRYRNEEETIQYKSDEVYGITIHELAHTAHVLTMNNVIDFWNVSSQIQESWPVAVQWHLTNLEYRSRGITNYGSESYFVSGLRRPHVYAYQYWKMSTSPDYTSLFINLVDDYNELGQNFFERGTGTANDQVSGYSLGAIQSNFLKHCYSHASLKTYLKGYKPAGVTDAQIDLLMSFY